MTGIGEHVESKYDFTTHAVLFESIDFVTLSKNVVPLPMQIV